MERQKLVVGILLVLIGLGGLAAVAVFFVSRSDDSSAERTITAREEGTLIRFGNDLYRAANFTHPLNWTQLVFRERRFVEWIFIALTAIIPAIVGTAAPIGQAQANTEAEWVKVNAS